MEKNKPGIVRKTDTYTERFVLFLAPIKSHETVWIKFNNKMIRIQNLAVANQEFVENHFSRIWPHPFFRRYNN